MAWLDGLSCTKFLITLLKAFLPSSVLLSCLFSQGLFGAVMSCCHYSYLSSLHPDQDHSPQNVMAADTVHVKCKQHLVLIQEQPLISFHTQYSVKVLQPCTVLELVKLLDTTVQTMQCLSVCNSFPKCFPEETLNP